MWCWDKFGPCFLLFQLWSTFFVLTIKLVCTIMWVDIFMLQFVDFRRTSSCPGMSKVCLCGLLSCWFLCFSIADFYWRVINRPLVKFNDENELCWSWEPSKTCSTVGLDDCSWTGLMLNGKFSNFFPVWNIS